MKIRYITTTLLSLIGGSILLTSTAFSDEITSKPTTFKVAEDPAVTLITNKLLTPIIQQDEDMYANSSSFRFTYNNYDLVEITRLATKNTRIFHITNTETNISINSSETIIYSWDINDINDRLQMKIIHEVKYLNDSHTFLVKQGNDWLAAKDHAFLKLISKPVKADNTATK